MMWSVRLNGEPFGRYRRRVPTAALDVFLAAPHEASAPFPRIQIRALHRFSESVVELRHDVRLFDLRDPQPDRLGIERDQLVSTRPVNDRWARRWAARLVGRKRRRAAGTRPAVALPAGFSCTPAL